MSVPTKSWLQISVADLAVLVTDQIPILVVEVGVDLNIWQHNSIEVDAKLKDFCVIDKSTQSKLAHIDKVDVVVEVFSEIES